MITFSFLYLVTPNFCVPSENCSSNNGQTEFLISTPKSDCPFQYLKPPPGGVTSRFIVLDYLIAYPLSLVVFSFLFSFLCVSLLFFHLSLFCLVFVLCFVFYYSVLFVCLFVMFDGPFCVFLFLQFSLVVLSCFYCF